MNESTDLINLLAGCKKEDPICQKGLYDRYAPKMLVVAMRYSKTTHEAEDIIQEAFLKIFKNIDTLREHSKVEGWIKKIVINTALNQNRSKLYMFPMMEIEEGTSYSDEDLGLQDFQFQELLKMIQSLPTGCQIIFNMFAIEGYGHKEIAERLEISEGTSKSQYSRARVLLQEMVKNSQKVSYGAV